MGVTGKKVEKSGIGGRARTMAGAGPTEVHYSTIVLKPGSKTACFHLKMDHRVVPRLRTRLNEHPSANLS